MPAPTVTIRIKAGPQLMARIREAGQRLDITPGNFIELAIESELSRQEDDHAHERHTLTHLQRRLLSEGQSVTLELQDDDSDDDACQLCLRPVPARSQVEGPLLCDSCHALAKGAGSAP